MTLTVSAPCRIDFAGGTLDLWPLSSFLSKVVTLNHAISRRATVWLSTFDGDPERSLVKSRDQGLELLVSQAPPKVDEGPLALIALALRALPPPQPLRLEIESTVPKGSGLGASSTLLVATLSALAAVRGDKLADSALVALARDLEARLIGVPTGTQDYWSALRGGVNALDFAPGQSIGEARPDFRIGPALGQHFSRRLMIFFTGEAHFSAAPNWSMLKAYIEDEAGVRAAFDEVLAATHDALGAITRDEPEALEAAVRREWAARQRLSPAVCPPRIQAILSRITEGRRHRAQALRRRRRRLTPRLRPRSVARCRRKSR